MKFLRHSLILMAVIIGGAAMPAFAAGDDPLFVSLITNDPHRANMALTFSRNQLERGHPVTIFINDKGVEIASKTHAAKFADDQKALGELTDKGAVVLICSMCMKHYGVKEADLLPGIKVGSPEVTGDALFKANTKTLTW
jgi:sulfur relay (sulfurtransferase) complex TusBCD TusD component (DsrE family)